MDFELDDEQAMLREVSRSMLAANCTPELVRRSFESGQDLDDKLWQRGVELGWTSLVVPEKHDGAGQGMVELCLVAEELGRAVAPGPVLDTALVALLCSAQPSLASVASDLAEGASRAAWAADSTLTATTDGDRLRVSGRVAGLHAAAAVDHVAATAVMDGEPILVLIDSGELTLRRRTTLDQTRTWYSAELADTAAQLLEGTSSEVTRLDEAATVLVAADALGVGERLFEMTVDYVKVREQFGRPIGGFQAIKQKVATMAAILKGVRAATYYAAMALDARLEDAGVAVSVAKAHASEAINELAGEALQAHGGIGFTWEHDLHLYLRRARVDSLLRGAADVHHQRVLDSHL